VLAMLVFNIVWLLPFAWMVRDGQLAPVVGMALAYLPLVAICALLGAGREHS